MYLVIQKLTFKGKGDDVLRFYLCIEACKNYSCSPRQPNSLRLFKDQTSLIMLYYIMTLEKSVWPSISRSKLCGEHCNSCTPRRVNKTLVRHHLEPCLGDIRPAGQVRPVKGDLTDPQTVSIPTTSGNLARGFIPDSCQSLCSHPIVGVFETNNCHGTHVKL